jgi:uncharacterized membrane protein YidH (DUF202 family)
MKSKSILGIILILIGAAILAYGHFSYQSRETVIEVGPIKATAEKTHNVPVPPILGWVLIGVGAAVLVVPSRPKA